MFYFFARARVCVMTQGRIVSRCLSQGIAVYSPHTSWDVVDDGLTDWLISCFGKKRLREPTPLTYGYIFIDLRFSSKTFSRRYGVADQTAGQKSGIQSRRDADVVVSAAER